MHEPGADFRVDLVRNDDAPWDDFDPARYWELNYSHLRDDDRQVLALMEDHLTENPPVPGAVGIDVGPGTNLYPALAMLPFCRTITLWEYSRSNVAWLRGELRAYRAHWDAFWAVVARARRRAGGQDWWAREVAARPRAALARSARVVRASVFDLPAAAFDVGTMCFVAESMTAAPDEFEQATSRFVGCLKPGAPFAAAFMEGSIGYQVGAYRFPAVPVTIDDVGNCLTDLTHDLQLHRVHTAQPLRVGYEGTMILAVGRAGNT